MTGSRSCIESNEMRTCWELATTLDVGKMRASWRLTRSSRVHFFFRTVAWHRLESTHGSEL